MQHCILQLHSVPQSPLQKHMQSQCTNHAQLFPNHLEEVEMYGTKLGISESMKTS